MQKPVIRKLITLLAAFAALWLAIRYILPIAMPFLLGAGLAVAAEPAVHLAQKRLRLPRGFAAGIGVSSVLILLLGVVVLICSVLVREMGQLANILPDIAQTAQEGMSLLESFLLNIAAEMPEGIRPMLTKSVLNLFSSSSALMDQLGRYLPGIARGILSHVPDGALTLGTAIISSFMISARLPQLKHRLAAYVPQTWRSRYLPAIKKARTAIGGWLKAQIKLSGMSFLIITVGLVVLGMPYAPVWALLTALVDAFPLLGSGTVLIPWALVSFLQGEPVKSLGLLGIYAAAALTRSVLEPRLVGKQLGLDSLLTLVALYAGYQFFGILGMLLAPILAVAAVEVAGSTVNQLPHDKL